MKRLGPLVVVAVTVWVVYTITTHPTEPPKTYGQIAREECRREASLSKIDQDECYSKKLLAKALEVQAERDQRR